MTNSQVLQLKMKSPYIWDTQEVAQFINTLGISGASDKILAHNIEGRDLMDLSEADIRNDLGFDRIHERKYLMRALQDLKNGSVWFVKVLTASGLIRIRIDSPKNYTFLNLTSDVSRFLGLSASSSLIQDSQGNVWGDSDLSLIFDSSSNQKEDLYFYHPSLSMNLNTECNSEDFNEDNPHHTCIQPYDAEESKSKELCYSSPESSMVSDISFLRE